MPMYLPSNIEDVIIKRIISGKIINKDGNVFHDNNPKQIVVANKV